ncbi:MAG: hypothetical protein KY475_14115, partial [Planctomycetes bacterium]|nr:hypothetical protein [Planctomycetota bacterium]
AGVAMATITLTFAEPLLDDRFTLILEDAITDPVGNRLDGETNADEPQESPIFPSGDRIPGGDFNVRFTVDSRPEVGVYSGRTIVVDTNGNGVFDPRNDKDFTDRDIVYMFGFITDDLFVGNFTFGATADGFDKLAAYGTVGGGVFRFLIDSDNDGVANEFPGGKPGGANNTAAINAAPVAGNFDGDPLNGDEVGLFDGTTWYLDTNHNFNVDPAEGDLTVVGLIRGASFVGDFDGDGVEDLATFNDFRGRIEIDLAADGYGDIDRVLLFSFPGLNERPVAADVNQDGFDDIGLFVPQQGAATPDEQALFHILVSADITHVDGMDPTIVSGPLWTSSRAFALDPADRAVLIADIDGVVPAGQAYNMGFRPEPFGEDLLLPFGENFALPLLGNFDPPVASSVGTFVNPVGAENFDTNPVNNLDVDGNGVVNVADLLPIVNDQRAHGVRPASADGLPPYLDVDGNGLANIADLLPVIEFLRGQQNSSAGGEGEAFDGLFLDDDEEEEELEAAIDAIARARV